ncbi:hypothetical protein R3P38DRAFT_3227890 [Favolaschia claudopus]|uniref:Uncharacterized protein n=1 Tax=Favolaschia claudopus TaxID=2862362 RepID=A0AAV9ZR45_9AGAR
MSRRRRRVDSDDEGPSTPERRQVFADILNLTQEISPSNSPRRAKELRASLQSLLNDLQNQAPPPPPRKRRKRHNRFEDAPQSVDDAPALEERVREAGRGFAVEESLFLVNEKDTWDPQREAVVFDPEHEYDAEENRVQSQIDEIGDILPREARGMRTEEWIADTFMDGLKQQRPTAAHRVRQASASYLVDADDRALFDEGSTARFNEFSDLIGYVKATNDVPAHYSAFKAPILYDTFDGNIDVDHIFRNPLLLKIHASMIRGEHGAKGLFTNRGPNRPRARTVDKIHHITRTSSGAIANAAVLAIRMFSADILFTPCGEETGIKYQALYEAYVKRLREGLRLQDSWALELFHHWDSILFPNSDDSLGHSAAGDQAAADAEKDEVDAAFNVSGHRSPSVNGNDNHSQRRPPPQVQSSSAGPSHARHSDAAGPSQGHTPHDRRSPHRSTPPPRSSGRRGKKRR